MTFQQQCRSLPQYPFGTLANHNPEVTYAIFHVSGRAPSTLRDLRRAFSMEEGESVSHGLPMAVPPVSLHR